MSETEVTLRSHLSDRLSRIARLLKLRTRDRACDLPGMAENHKSRPCGFRAPLVKLAENNYINATPLP